MTKRIIKVFIKKTGCIKYQGVLEYSKTLRGRGVEFEICGVVTVYSLAEASFYGVVSTPTIIRVDDQGEEISRFDELNDPEVHSTR